MKFNFGQMKEKGTVPRTPKPGMDSLYRECPEARAMRMRAYRCGAALLVVAVMIVFSVSMAFGAPGEMPSEAGYPDLRILTAHPSNPSIGQEVIVLARFRYETAPRSGSVSAELLNASGGVLREVRGIPAVLETPMEPGRESEWTFKARFVAEPAGIRVRFSWTGWDGVYRTAGTALQVGGAEDPGDAGGLVEYRVIRDATRDGDEMRTEGVFSSKPDEDSVRLIIERRGPFSGLYDDRVVLPDRSFWKDGQSGGTARWVERFEFTAEQGRWRMKLRWRVNGREYERTKKFSVTKDVNGTESVGGCSMGWSGALLLLLVPAMVGSRMFRPAVKR